MIWITANKERINVCDMTNEHLENTIAYLYRKEESIKAVNEKYGLKINHQINNREIKEWLDVMIDELKKRIALKEKKERLEKQAVLNKSITILKKKLWYLEGKKKKRKRLEAEISKMQEEYSKLFGENGYDIEVFDFQYLNKPASEQKKVYREVLGGIIEDDDFDYSQQS